MATCRESRIPFACNREILTPKGVAKALDDYMRFRAGREGVGYEMSVSFYLKAMKKGCHLYFGVEICCCGLVADTQQPALFEEWTSTKH